jgi:riboflavin transporter FmnP
MAKGRLQSPEGVDIARLRGLFMRMIAIEVVCVGVAVASFLGYDLGHIPSLLWVFIGALVAGFGAQLWFVTAWLQVTKGSGSADNHG